MLAIFIFGLATLDIVYESTVLGGHVPELRQFRCRAQVQSRQL